MWAHYTTLKKWAYPFWLRFVLVFCQQEWNLKSTNVQNHLKGASHLISENLPRQYRYLKNAARKWFCVCLKVLFNVPMLGEGTIILTKIVGFTDMFTDK